MFWTFLLIFALGVILVKLGSYSVWVVVLTIGLKSALLALLLVVIYFFVNRFKNNSWFNRSRIIRGKVIKDG